MRRAKKCVHLILFFVDLRQFPDHIYPWPKEPPSPYHTAKPERASDTWLAARINDGHGSRSMQVQNFHWKVRNALDLEALKEFQGHIGRLEQVRIVLFCFN